MAEQDFWIDDEIDGVPPRWPVVDGSGEMSRVIAYCPTSQDAERIIAALAASEREQRMRTAAQRLLAQLEIAPTTCCRMHDEGHTDDCPQEALRAALSETGPAGPGRGAEHVD